MRWTLKYFFFWSVIMTLVTYTVNGQNYDLVPVPKFKIEADGLPQKPSLKEQQNISVYDYAKLLSDDQRRQLQQKISKYYDSTSTQIVVATVDKVNDDISLYAAEWAHKWGLGQKGKNNGVFVLLSKGDKKVTISTGYGTEPLLTDAMSRRIIETQMIPYFKQGQYYQGLDAGITAIQKVLSGEFVNDLPSDEGIPVWVIILLIIFFIIIISSLSKGDQSGGGWTSGGGGPIIFSSSGRSSWGGGGSFGGGSFGGGGFSGGFGGGGFGGGGATGSW